MKVVIYYKKLNIGGAERSSVELANGFARRGHDITFFMGTKGGALDSELLPEVKIMYFYKDTGALKKWDRTVKGLFKVPVWDLIDAGVQYILGTIRRIFYYIKKEPFDLGITSFHGYSPQKIKTYTNCKVHLKVIRNENAIEFNGVPVKNIAKYKDEYDAGIDGYVCVSKKLRDIMVQYCDIPEKDIHTIYNIVRYDNMKKDDFLQPKEYALLKPEVLKIVTVCRLLDSAKGLVRMVEVCKELVKKGYSFKWFVVGDGPDADKLNEAIIQNELSDTMIICGFQKDPRPYYMYADLVAVLSYVEGFCRVVTEAKLLEKPLIATNFIPIEEQITHGINGHIVDNSNVNSIVEGLAYLIQNTEYRNSLGVNKLPKEILDNEYKIQQYEELFDIYKDGH